MAIFSLFSGVFRSGKPWSTDSAPSQSWYRTCPSPSRVGKCDHLLISILPTRSWSPIASRNSEGSTPFSVAMILAVSISFLSSSTPISANPLPGCDNAHASEDVLTDKRLVFLGFARLLTCDGLAVASDGLDTGQKL